MSLLHRPFRLLAGLADARTFVHELAVFTLLEELLVSSFSSVFFVIFIFSGTEILDTEHFLKGVFCDFNLNRRLDLNNINFLFNHFLF